mmetsp:Transcript_29885/g.62964  ORF Transcript_29885/g.62964 Transcript_29885/m.62964 type:complete len:592 (-) Transcript_29885:651-2426(-)
MLTSTDTQQFLLHASIMRLPGLLSLLSCSISQRPRCCTSQPYDDQHAALLGKAEASRHLKNLAHSSPLIYSLSPPPEPLLPDSSFCNTVKQSQLYGWRRVHLHKMLMFRRILNAGFDLLSLDANYLILLDPMPLIYSIRPPGSDHLSDVVAMHDGPQSQLLNIGVIWIRSNKLTCAMALRAENRTWGGWDQYIFNDELNYNPTYEQISCCHTPCLTVHLKSQKNAADKDSYPGSRRRQLLDGEDRCAEAVPSTLPPSEGSLFYTPQTPWQQGVYNVPPPAGWRTQRKLGRCTMPNQLCQTTEGSAVSCPPVRARAQAGLFPSVATQNTIKCNILDELFRREPTGEQQLKKISGAISVQMSGRGGYPTRQQVLSTLFHSDADPYAKLPSLNISTQYLEKYGSSAKKGKASIISAAVAALGKPPQLILEVGSFIGTSAVYTWGPLARMGGGLVLCIDSWQGDLNMRLGTTFQKYMQLEHGFPQLGRLFLNRIVKNNFTDVVIPIAMPSITAARLLAVVNWTVDLVYVDSSHEQGETLVELHMYWNLLRPGGVLMGDAFSVFPAVKQDAKLFASCHGVQLSFPATNVWLLHKPV